ncbi:MAG: hypothetical protein R2822_00395 [Spirosomataceae bacterium]
MSAADAGVGAVYEWRKGNSLVSSDREWTLTNVGDADAGIYRLIVTLGSCNDEDTARVEVYPTPKLSVIDAACAPNLKSYTVDLTAEGGVVAANDGVITPQMSPVYVISAIKTTTNPLTISVTSNKGCLVSQAIAAPDCSCPQINAPVSEGNQKICEDKPLPALAVSVGDNETVDWYETASGGVPILVGSTSFVPQAAGTFYAQTRHLINDCVSNTRTPISLTIAKLPKLTIDSTVCGQDLSNFVIWLTTEISGVSVTASEGAVVNFSNGRYEIIAINPVGNPSVTVTVTNLDGCEQKIIVQKPDCQCPDLKPPVNNGDKTICLQETIPALQATVGINETVDWYDSPNGGNKIATDTTSYAPTETAVGTYTFYAETRRTDITVRTCVSNTRTPIKLTIKSLPDVAPTSNSALCQGQDLQLNTPANTNATYQWIGPGGFNATQRSPLRVNAQPDMSGEYVVVVTLNGCIATDTTTVLVKPLPVATTEGATVCQNSVLSLKTPQVPNAVYEWTNANNQVVSTDSLLIIPQMTLAKAGTYQVKVTLNGCSQTDTANVGVIALPLAKAMINAPICSGDTLKLTAADAGIGATYLWKNPTGVR